MFNNKFKTFNSIYKFCFPCLDLLCCSRQEKCVIVLYLIALYLFPK